MVCNNCKGSWNPPVGITITTCPFCQADLAPTPEKNNDTPEDILKSIVNQFSPAIYTETDKFKSLLADYFVKDKNTLKILSVVIAHGASNTLCQLSSLDEASFELERRKLILSISDESLISAAIIEKGINLLCQGLDKACPFSFQEEAMPTPEASTPPASTPPIAPMPNTDGWSAEAKECLQLAMSGDAEAQWRLGFFHYEDGDGTPKDQRAAIYWIEKAAAQGLLEAQLMLNDRYYEGDGVAKDEKKAAYWLEKAANQGDSDAQSELGICYQDGIGVAQNEKTAVFWYEKAAMQGNADAQYMLGACYFEGKGVTKNNKEAIRWFEKAAANGCEDAEEFLSHLNHGSLTYDAEGFRIKDGILIAYYGDEQNLTIPQGVTEIAKNAFRANKIIRRVSFPNTLECIGEYAFYMCRNLDDVVIPPSVKVLRQSSFSNCINLYNVTITNNDIDISKGLMGGSLEAFDFSPCKKKLKRQFP